MSAALNNFIKYNFIIRTLIQILYNFHIRETLNLLRIENTDAIKIKIVTITIYPAIIKSVVVETSFVIKNSSINRRRIMSFKVIISIRSPIATSYVKGSTFITFMKTISFAKKTSFIVTPHIVIINEYRSSYIDVKNAIAFAFFKIKKIYDTRH